MNKKGILIILSGFSGVGKGTVVRRLLSDSIITHFPFPQQHENLVKEMKMGCHIFSRAKKSLNR